MTRREGIIYDAEQETGKTFDDDLDILCDGDTCRHSECVCWDDFRDAVTDRLRG